MPDEEPVNLPHHRYFRAMDPLGSIATDPLCLNILDLGCGTGAIASHFAEAGHVVTGIDQAEARIETARNLFPKPRFEVRSLYDDLGDLAPAGGWDVVISLEVIEHLYSPDSFLANTHRQIKPGGTLFISTPYHGFLKNLAISAIDGWDKHHHPWEEGGHIKFFSPRSLKSMVEKHNFRLEWCRGAGRAPWLWESMFLKAAKLN